MTDMLILDTGVFLNILAGSDTEGRVYQKIIRRFDRVAIHEELLDEYKTTLATKFSGLVPYMITTRLSELSSYNKVVKVPAIDKPLLDIDEEDRHVVSAAKSARAKYLITSDQRHLWNNRNHIKASHHIEVLRPVDYIALPE
ncbi:MAG TPA: putative toxin-antitoxin system toxin component, PIN family [Candidatus Bathyarchaeia archaeon]|nr:putative toxin-antitoxin system toxin component, PIN family [Candidatus Bathyarchaeia archaeon]